MMMRKLLLLSLLAIQPLGAKRKPKPKPESYKTYLLGGVGGGVLILGGVLYFRDPKKIIRGSRRERDEIILEDAKLKVNNLREDYIKTDKHKRDRGTYKKALDREISRLYSLKTPCGFSLKYYVYSYPEEFLLDSDNEYEKPEN